METSIVVPANKQENVIEMSIIQRIREIRGVKVILDFDLAEQYGVETRALKQAVRRNLKRFEGDDFMFELTKNETTTLSRSQFVTLNKGRGSNIKYMPFAFTELGVAMLSSVLNSDTAIDINRKIMRAFVAIRQYVLNYSELNQKIEKFIQETNVKFDNNDVKTNEIFELLGELLEHKKELEKPRKRIGFDTGANS
jgi:hypothetical protein